MTAERQAKVWRLAAAGHTLTETATTPGILKQTIMKWAVSRGVKFAKGKPFVPPHPLKVTREQIEQGRRDGLHANALAWKLGVRAATVRKASRAHGIELPFGNTRKMMAAILEASPVVQARWAEQRREAAEKAVERAALSQPDGLAPGSLVDVLPSVLARGLTEHLDLVALPSWPVSADLTAAIRSACSTAILEALWGRWCEQVSLPDAVREVIRDRRAEPGQGARG